MRVLMLLIFAGLISACGQAGDLYLPDQKPGHAPPPPPSTNPDPAKKDQK